MGKRFNELIRNCCVRLSSYIAAYTVMYSILRLLVILTAPSHRALVRMGNVYYKQKQWKEAIKYFDDSLAEHRNAEVLKKKQTVSE